MSGQARWHAITLLALALVACGPLSGGNSSCDSAHVSLAELRESKPELPGMIEVRGREHDCSDSELGVAEARLYYDYAAASGSQAAATAFLEAAVEAGWEPTSPAKSPLRPAADDRIHVNFIREVNGLGWTLSATVFDVSTVRTRGDRGEGLDRIEESGAPTGVSLVIGSKTVGAIATIEFRAMPGVLADRDPGLR